MHKSIICPWWIIILKAVLVLVFGATIMLAPDVTLRTIMIIFGIYAVSSGVIAILSSEFRIRHVDRHWIILFGGVLSIGFGLFALLHTSIMTMGALWLIAGHTLMTGVLQMLFAAALRQDIEDEHWLSITGLFSVIVGALISLWPGATILSLLWLLEGYAIITSMLLIKLAMRIRQLQVVKKDCVRPS